MNPRNPQLRELLAAEYVLGTLHGRARRRFARLLTTDPELRTRVVAWEDRLGPLAEQIEPVTPPERVWRALEVRIGAEPPRRSRWRRVAFWRGLALAASLAAIAFAALFVAFVTRAPSSLAPSFYVAVVQSQTGLPLWLVAADLSRDKLEVRTLSAPPAAPDKSLELWLLPAGEGSPISLGLLPTEGAHSVLLPAPDRWERAKGVAVSLEPAGGSPTGQPTGPVLYQSVFVGRTA